MAAWAHVSRAARTGRGERSGLGLEASHRQERASRKCPGGLGSLLSSRGKPHMHARAGYIALSCLAQSCVLRPPQVRKDGGRLLELEQPRIQPGQQQLILVNLVLHPCFVKKSRRLGRARGEPSLPFQPLILPSTP